MLWFRKRHFTRSYVSHTNTHVSCEWVDWIFRTAKYRVISVLTVRVRACAYVSRLWLTCRWIHLPQHTCMFFFCCRPHSVRMINHRTIRTHKHNSFHWLICDRLMCGKHASWRMVFLCVLVCSAELQWKENTHRYRYILRSSSHSLVCLSASRGFTNDCVLANNMPGRTC